MAVVYLVRHGRATGGWDVDADPGLDVVGARQADELASHLPAQIAARLGLTTDEVPSLPILTSPLRRCRETAVPIAQRWGTDAVVEPVVTEIPSPPGVPMGERVAWLRQSMTGAWTSLGDRYTSYRDGVVERIRSIPTDAVVISHFVAINAVIGACLDDDRVVIRSLDNASITVVEVGPTGLVLVEGGREADTLIR